VHLACVLYVCAIFAQMGKFSKIFQNFLADIFYGWPQRL
jgi:hypothetical protein